MARIAPLSAMGFPHGLRTPGQEADDDARLLDRVRQGDHDAFSTLVRRHAPTFHRLAFRLLRQPQEAEDVVQEAFLKLWERPMLWDAAKATRFTTWFYRVVTNLCLDRLRRGRPLGSDALPDTADPAESVELRLVRHSDEAMLEREMSALPERQRVALSLSYFEGLPNAEAAEAMGLHLKAFQSLLLRARQALRKRIEPYA